MSDLRVPAMSASDPKRTSVIDKEKAWIAATRRGVSAASRAAC
jgi:hypothetical protein